MERETGMEPINTQTEMSLEDSGKMIRRFTGFIDSKREPPSKADLS